MEFVLLVSSGDWGDEFDLEGFAIFEKNQWENIKDGIPDEPFEASFGSNEFVTFENKADYLSYIKEKPIMVEEIKFLQSLLDLYPIGVDNLIKNGRGNIQYGLFVINSENY